MTYIFCETVKSVICSMPRICKMRDQEEREREEKNSVRSSNTELALFFARNWSLTNPLLKQGSVLGRQLMILCAVQHLRTMSLSSQRRGLWGWRASWNDPFRIFRRMRRLSLGQLDCCLVLSDKVSRRESLMERMLQPITVPSSDNIGMQ